MNETIVSVKNVTMRFNLAEEKTDTIKEYILKLIQGKLHFNPFLALKDVSFQVNKGDAVALIGRNGCGKSTLLKTIAGVFYPTYGSVEVNGSIAPLIELGAGFDMDLTARENIYLNGAILGHDREFMDRHFNEIVDFAELWDFIDIPVKNYSSGMIARLGFSIATVVEADLLIVDEILAVGDYKFQEKCYQKMNDMLANGATLIFVSHDINTVRNLCNKAVWLSHGVIQSIGEVNSVCDAYCAYMDRGDEKKYRPGEGSEGQADGQVSAASVQKESYSCGRRLQLFAAAALILLSFAYLGPNQYGDWYGSGWFMDLLARPLNLAWNGTWLALLMLMMGSGAMTAALFGGKNRRTALSGILRWLYLPALAASVFGALLYGGGSFLIPALSEGIISPFNAVQNVTLAGILMKRADLVWYFNEFGNYILAAVLGNLFFAAVYPAMKGRFKRYAALTGGIVLVLLLLGKANLMFWLIQPLWYIGIVFMGQLMYLACEQGISTKLSLALSALWYFLMLNSQRTYLWDNGAGPESLITSLALCSLFLLAVLTMDRLDDNAEKTIDPLSICFGAAWWCGTAVGGKLAFLAFFKLGIAPPFIVKLIAAVILIGLISLGSAAVEKAVKVLLDKGENQ